MAIGGLLETLSQSVAPMLERPPVRRIFSK